MVIDRAQPGHALAAHRWGRSGQRTDRQFPIGHQAVLPLRPQVALLWSILPLTLESRIILTEMIDLQSTHNFLGFFYGWLHLFFHFMNFLNSTFSLSSWTVCKFTDSWQPGYLDVVYFSIMQQT